MGGLSTTAAQCGNLTSLSISNSARQSETSGGVEMIDHSHYEFRLASWDDIFKAYMGFSESGQQWIFRGQSSAEMRLRSSLERAIFKFGSGNKAFAKPEQPEDFQYQAVLAAGLEGRQRHSAFQIELGLLRRFKRQCYIYASQLPHDDDIMEWFALMRHYGAPTRLLDWTYSFFVALFFAVDHAQSKAAVWALDTDWLRHRMSECYKTELDLFDSDPNIHKGTFKKLFGADTAQPTMYAVNPYRRNERLSIQQGIFLCPGRVDVPFEENFTNLLDVSNATDVFHKLVLDIESSTRNKILRHLLGMNVHNAALFPGLEGFAKSLEVGMANPDSLIPEPI
jgi:hypothetical protein